jgi:hypothetical protein
MADVITLTAQPIRVTTPPAAGTWQAIWVVRDVLDYDVLDLEFGVVGFEGPTSNYKMLLSLYTSLQRENDEDWIWIGTTASLTPTTPFSTLSFTGGFLRYIRWLVPWGLGLWGSQTAATFWIRGMARTYEADTSGVRGQ